VGAQIVCRHVLRSLAENDSERPRIEFAMHRYGQCLPATIGENAPQLNVAAPLADGYETELAEDVGYVSAGKALKFWHLPRYRFRR
jgi:hypothetical protein